MEPPGDSVPTADTGGGGGPAPAEGAGEPVPDEEPGPPRVRHVPEEYASIQAAVDAARPRDTVRVAPGVYSEHVRLKSGIRLEGSGAQYTVLDGRGVSLNLVDFTDATGVEIRGFTFRNVGSATHCTMTWDMYRWCGGNWYAAAIYADGHTATSAVIEHNVFERNEHHEKETFQVPSRVRLGEDGNEVGEPGFLDPEAGDFRLEPGTVRQTPRCLDGAYDTGEYLTRRRP